MEEVNDQKILESNREKLKASSECRKDSKKFGSFESIKPQELLTFKQCSPKHEINEIKIEIEKNDMIPFPGGQNSQSFPINQTLEFLNKDSLPEIKKIDIYKKKCNCPNVLIVDDNDFNVYALKNFLTIFGIQAELALSGDIAIQLLKEKFYSKCCRKYDLIFMDVEMPEKNGIETTREIIELAKEKKILPSIIIGTSGYNDQQSVESCLQAGMSDYIEKPVSREHLEKILKLWLKDKQT